MPTLTGFFCQLEVPTVAKIKRLALRHGVAQRVIIEDAVASIGEAAPAKVTAKSNGQEMLARALAKDATLPFFKRRPKLTTQQQPTRAQLNVLRAHKVHVTPGSLSRAAAAKMITEVMIAKRAKREGRAAKRRVKG